MVCDKVRIRFRKGGDLRLISHHDLLRCFERMLRRAALPFHSTEGFNPKPRLVFALSLPLGVTGCEEVVELELDVEVPPQEVHERLARQAPPGLEVLRVQRVPPRTTAQVRQVTYRVAVPPGPQEDLSDRIASLLARPECWVERPRARRPRMDIRPFLLNLCLSPAALEMTFRVTPNGTARPDEVLDLLGLGGLLDAGAVLERTRLELEDETPAATALAGARA
jgi:radical SAM-linked protein